jgi:RNA polymerase sigma factor (sigma-70 family)
MTTGMKQVQPLPDEDLLISLQQGDEKALRDVYRRHYHMVVNMVTTNGGSLQEAKDVYQEAVIVFCEKIKEENFQLNCLIKTFLYSVSRRLWLKQLQRKQKFTDPIQDADEYIDVSLDDVKEKEDRYDAMHTALESLGEPCKSILKDFYLRNQSMEEITDKFGYTNADNAKNQKYKCLKRLKKVFFEVYQKQGGEEYDQ